MDKKELQEILMRMNIPKSIYSLNGGLPNEKYCLEQNETGWSVYYSERGVKSNLKHFSEEGNACDYLYKKILNALDI